MPDLILHHYPMSPFSEKIRAMLGYAGLGWQSVTVREMPPRPKLELLTGGYRKIPVAQIGADVFCDTRTIDREIAALGNKPELVLEDSSEAVQTFVRDTDLKDRIAIGRNAREPVTGVLASARGYGWVLRREAGDLGTLHIHLPHQGYIIQEV